MTENSPPNRVEDPEGWIAWRDSQMAPAVMALRDMLTTLVDLLHDHGVGHPIQEYQAAGIASYVGQKLAYVQKVYAMEAQTTLEVQMGLGPPAPLEERAGIGEMLAEEAQRWLRKNG